MKQIITDVDGYSNFMINLEDLDIDIRIKYVLYSVIDALINKVSENIWKKYFNDNKKYITLEELAEIYKIKNWYNNDGLPGVFFERFVYNMLVIKEYENLNSFILNCLNRLDISKGNDFDVILWGTEKGSWLSDFSLNSNLDIIDETDYIFMNNQPYNFKDILIKFYHSNKKYNGFEKADLFVKLKNSNRWFGVDIKLNIEDFSAKNKTILPIRIALKTNNIIRLQKQLFDLRLEPNTFIFPKDNDYGELSMRYYRYMLLLLENIARNNKYKINKELYEFDTELTLFFLENKKESLFKILDFFERDILSKGVQVPERKIIENTCNTFLLNRYDCSCLKIIDEDNIVSVG